MAINFSLRLSYGKNSYRKRKGQQVISTIKTDDETAYSFA